jgi:PLP dependent protein
MTRQIEVAQNLAALKSRITRAALSCGRNPEEITLIAVTKTFPLSDIQILYDLGERNFGENRDQEGSAKAPELADDCIWHFQGQIQSNKLKSIASWADVIHSIDDFSHAQKLSALVEKKDIFLQVSLGDGLNRGGIDPESLPGLIDQILALENLKIRGLMSVAPLEIDPDIAFSALAKVRDEVAQIHPEIREISAGMSHDFESAIKSGATHIRVGSQILGVRA